MQLLVAMNFVDDLDAMTIERLTRLGYRGRRCDRAFDRFATLDAFTERTIPPIPYTIRLSAEIRQNPKLMAHKKAVDEITTRLRSGETLRPYLSRQAVAPAYKDGLLLSWGIHHLHLNTIDSAEKDGFVSRPRGRSELLLVRIEGQTAYLIEIVPHSEQYLFWNPRLLEIVDRNWPELHIAPKLITGNEFTPEQIKLLRTYWGNYAIAVNGRTIFPKSMTSAGVPVETQMRYRVLCEQLRAVESDVRHRFYEFFPHKASPELSWPAIHEVRLVGIEDDYFVLQDRSTLRLCHAQHAAARPAKKRA